MLDALLISILKTILKAGSTILVKIRDENLTKAVKKI